MARKAIDSQRVMDAAVEVADALGFDALTLSAVAEKLNIRIPSLYNYMDGLPGLRRMLTLWGMRQLIDLMRRAAVGVAGADAIYAVAKAYRAFAHAHPGVYPATLRAYPDDDDINAIAMEIVVLLKAILAPYNPPDDQTALYHSIRVFRSLMHGFVDLERQGGFGLPLNLDETFHYLVASYVAGLTTPVLSPQY